MSDCEINSSSPTRSPARSRQIAGERPVLDVVPVHFGGVVPLCHVSSQNVSDTRRGREIQRLTAVRASLVDGASTDAGARFRAHTGTTGRGNGAVVLREGAEREGVQAVGEVGIC